MSDVVHTFFSHQEKIIQSSRRKLVEQGLDYSTQCILGLDPHPSIVGRYLVNSTEQNTVVDIYKKFLEYNGSLDKLVGYCKRRQYFTKTAPFFLLVAASHANQERNLVESFSPENSLFFF